MTPDGNAAAGDGSPPTPVDPQSRMPAAQARRSGYFWFLSLAALGVVYGDIGTSPLYAIRESFGGHFGVEPTAANVLGVLSLITWSLILIVALKYIIIVLRADNDGEGGIIALVALANRKEADPSTPRRGLGRVRHILVLVGLFGAALLYGDGMLTPAVSVLSAVEGIGVYQPSLAALVVPATIAILVGVFLVQRHGTAQVGRFFGPVMVVWFLTLAALGIRGILLSPQVLTALNPSHALEFFARNGLGGILVLGAVFLVVTGAEALYADLGHFGPKAIRLAWFALVMPALLLNYYGQCALVLSDASTTTSPFYLLAPAWGLVPLIILSTAAAIIASQAVISGVFSLTMQAVQLGYWPRTRVDHTSPQEFGQIYVAPMNWILLVGTILLVLTFRSSSALAAAYGVAIICTMVVTTILLYLVLPERAGWPTWAADAILTVFLFLELLFLAANVLKIHEGGWVTLLIALAVFVMMTTWRNGREVLGRRLNERLQPLPRFLETLSEREVPRVPGNAVYMTGHPGVVPQPLMMNLEHQKALHERVLLLTVLNEKVPHVRADRRVQTAALGHGLHQVWVRSGFMDRPDILRVIRDLKLQGLDIPLEETTFFLGRERIMAREGPWHSRWRFGLFSFLSRNSQRATAFFNIPPERVVEIGSQIEV